MRVGKSEQLEHLAREAGMIYTRTLVTFWKILRKKDQWLSKYGMQRLIRSKALHSQSTQGIVEIFYRNIESWKALRKSNPKARLPKRHKRYFTIPYKQDAIKVANGKLMLSNGRGNAPLVFDWRYDRPKFITISYDEGYIINAVYKTDTEDKITSGDTAGVDLGEIHIAVAATANKTIIINGRELRSKKRYLNKETAVLQSRIDKCKKGSNRRKRLSGAMKRLRNRLNNQIKDILHKQTTKLVYALKEEHVKTVVIGDVRNLRQNVDYGRHINQKIHGMTSGKARQMLQYKSEKVRDDACTY